MNNKMENNMIEDELLENVNGGTGNAGNLLFKGKEKKKAGNTLYSGQPVKAGNLLYKDKDNELGTIQSDGPTFC